MPTVEGASPQEFQDSPLLQPRRLLILAYLLAIVALFIAQSVAFITVEPLLREHRFNDTDSYTWMGRV